MDSQGRAGALPAEAARLGLSLPSWTGVRDEAVALLRQLIAADTSNPPGNETRAATVLQDYLGLAGIPSRLLGEEADRMNLLARVSAGRPGPRVLLLSHLDVVPALEADWEVPPFAGVVKDGCIWGRGARDMKNQTAAHAVAVARLVQSRRPFDGEVVLAATCDEEVTTRNGARWLLATHPGLLECDYLLTEPVATCGPRASGNIQMLAVGEKTVAAFRVTVRGRSGHGSVPVHAESAVTRMAEVVLRLENARGDVTLSPVVREALGVIVPDDGLRDGLLEERTASETLRKLIEGDVELARCVEPLMMVTFSPSVVRCDSVAFNVVPGTVTLEVDCRLPPGQQPDDVRELVCRTLAGVLQTGASNGSKCDTAGNPGHRDNSGTQSRTQWRR